MTDFWKYFEQEAAANLTWLTPPRLGFADLCVRPGLSAFLRVATFCSGL